MSRRAVFVAVALAALVSCRRQEPIAPTTYSRSTPAKPAVVAAPPANLQNKRVDQSIPLGGPVLIDEKGIGPKLGPDGNVSGEVKTFKTTDPIHLTMKFHDSPHGLQSSITVDGLQGTHHYRDQRSMNGAKVVTFTVPAKKLKPGRYKVDGYWGGNLAAEYEVEVK